MDNDDDEDFRSMNKHMIEIIAQVLKSSSFKEAAYELNYSPSVISKHISKVEKELGVTLFNRSNRADSISLTMEGESLKSHFVLLHECFCKLQEDAVMLRRDAGNILTLGINSLVAISSVELIENFRATNPDINIDVRNDYPDVLEQQMYRKSIDGMFFRAQNGSENFRTLSNILSDESITAILYDHEPHMYMAISSKEPLAGNDEAPLSAFCDFYIVVHPDKNIREKGGLLEPFLRISEREGYELKTIMAAPNRVVNYDLVTKIKVAVPSTRSTPGYPGVKFVRVSNWDTYTVTYFLSLNSNNNHALKTFIKYLQNPSTQ